jgi:hypothetical protein
METGHVRAQPAAEIQKFPVKFPVFRERGRHGSRAGGNIEIALVEYLKPKGYLSPPEEPRRATGRAMTNKPEITLEFIAQQLGRVIADVAEIKADTAEIKAVQAEQSRDIALLRQDVTKLRNIQMGQEVKLDDVQDFCSRIAEGIERLRPPAVPPLGEGRVSEIRQMHSQINAVERKMAEFQARIEVLEGVRER